MTGIYFEYAADIMMVWPPDGKRQSMNYPWGIYQDVMGIGSWRLAFSCFFGRSDSDISEGDRVIALTVGF